VYRCTLYSNTGGRLLQGACVQLRTCVQIFRFVRILVLLTTEAEPVGKYC
jgi:hypothetical protein